MVKNNGYIIPKENYKKVEEVREIDNEIPSYEEFMKNYNENEEAVDSYENEFEAAVAAPIALGIGATGAGLMGLGHVTDSDGLKEFGKDVVEIAVNSKDRLDITSDSGINSAARNNYFRK